MVSSPPSQEQVAHWLNGMADRGYIKSEVGIDDRVLYTPTYGKSFIHSSLIYHTREKKFRDWGQYCLALALYAEAMSSEWLSYTADNGKDADT